MHASLLLLLPPNIHLVAPFTWIFVICSHQKPCPKHMLPHTQFMLRCFVAPPAPPNIHLVAPFTWILSWHFCHVALSICSHEKVAQNICCHTVYASFSFSFSFYYNQSIRWQSLIVHHLTDAHPLCKPNPKFHFSFANLEHWLMTLLPTAKISVVQQLAKIPRLSIPLTF